MPRYLGQGIQNIHKYDNTQHIYTRFWDEIWANTNIFLWLWFIIRNSMPPLRSFVICLNIFIAIPLFICYTYGMKMKFHVRFIPCPWKGSSIKKMYVLHVYMMFWAHFPAGYSLRNGMVFCTFHYVGYTIPCLWHERIICWCFWRSRECMFYANFIWFWWINIYIYIFIVYLIWIIYLYAMG